MRHLHDAPVVRKRARSAPRSVQSLGTSANPAQPQENREWWADLEYVWRMRTHDALQRLHRRAREKKRAARRAADAASAAYQKSDPDTGTKQARLRVELARSSEWAEHRAQAMALPRAEVIAACGKRWRQVRCGCGVQEVKVGCDQVQLCDVCRKRHWRRWRRRITRAMDAHVRAARAQWAHRRRRGFVPGVYLITLTVPHSGSIIQDRETLAKGWRKLTKTATAEDWWGAYALAYEVTPGEDGKGHVHAHIAAVSSWVPYDRLRAEWYRVSGAEILDVSPPRSGKVQNAADYLSKYVTKGVDPSVFTGQKAGELIVAMRGKRKVTTSVGFWTPTKQREIVCNACGKPHQSLGAPLALRRVAPGPVLQAMAERIGFFIPRGAIQSELRMPDG